MEAWKPVHRHSNYEVSDIGSVRRIAHISYGRRLPARLSTFTPSPDGYCRVFFRARCLKVARTVHSLVLEAFVSPRPKGMHAAHLNGVRHDNRLENLRWETPVNNNRHKWGHQTSGNKINSDVAASIKADFASGATNKSALGRKYGVSDVLVGAIIKGTVWSHA